MNLGVGLPHVMLTGEVHIYGGTHVETAVIDLGKMWLSKRWILDDLS